MGGGGIGEGGRSNSIVGTVAVTERLGTPGPRAGTRFFAPFGLDDHQPADIGRWDTETHALLAERPALVK